MKKYNLLLVRCTRYDDGTTIWDITTLGLVICCLVVVAALFGLVFGIVMVFEKAACGDVAEVTGLDVTYRNIGGCFIEVSDGMWVSDDAYFVGKVQRLE